VKASEETDQIFPALLKLQLGLRNPEKSETANVKGGRANYSYTYANLADTFDMVRPLASEAGLVILFPMEGDLLGCRITHAESGQWVESDSPMRIVGGQPQAVGGLLTYARRYVLTSFLPIAPDDDDDGNTAQGRVRTFEERRPQRQDRRPQQQAAKKPPAKRAAPQQRTAEDKHYAPGEWGRKNRAAAEKAGVDMEFFDAVMSRSGAEPIETWQPSTHLERLKWLGQNWRRIEGVYEGWAVMSPGAGKTGVVCTCPEFQAKGDCGHARHHLAGGGQ
jgi:hypothetical protein